MKIEKQHDGKTFQFAVSVEHDDCAGAPWQEHDGHGPVSDWTRRDKRPGEIVLCKDSRGACRFYNFAQAVKIAKRECWDAAPYNTDKSQTKGQQAAKAAAADLKYLRAWCNDEWFYAAITVTLLDDEGEETEIAQSIGGVELDRHYDEDSSEVGSIVDDLTHEILSGYGSAWGEVLRKTYAPAVNV